MKRTLITLVGLLGATTLFASSNAQEIFDAKCSMCHIRTMPPKDKSTLVAPPIMGVMRHVKMAYPQKQDALKFIVDYVQHPDRAKAVCMKQKISHFGLMPSQKGNITPAEIKEVASWLFDNYPPANFRGDLMKKKRISTNQMHKRGLTFEMIDANSDGVITKEEFATFKKKRMQMMKKNGMQCKGMRNN